MKKAGANYHDKARIVKMMDSRTPEQISMITSVRIEHVNAIIKQAREGTLKMMGPRGLMPFKIPGKSDYVQADVGHEENVEQRVAEHEVQEHKRQEAEALERRVKEGQEDLRAEREAGAEKDAEIEALKAELKEAKKKKAPARRGRKAAAAA